MDAYYWAGGEKVPLEEDARVAVDVAGARQAGLWDDKLADGTDTGTGVVLLPATDLPPDLRERLVEAGACHPVYRAADETVVVLPEVRVEAADEKTAAAVRAAVEDREVALDQPRPGRFVLTPGSHRGADALELANQLVETVHPDAAQARFLRITDDPDHDHEEDRT
jgi:hypothetical protein